MMLKNTNPKVTVITVCYNSEETIERAIESVLGQTYRPLEYLIIDGKSSDRTIDIANYYAGSTQTDDVSITIVSEKDNGIYDAMNKGIDLATGEWINFMNSDDRFHDNAVIDWLSDDLKGSSDVVYGDEYIRFQDGHIELNKRNSDMSMITKYLPFCHQSSFTRSALCKKYHFDTGYAYVADLDFFLKLYFWEKARFKYVDTAIADYYKFGRSNAYVLDAFREGTKLRVKYKYPGNIEMFEKAKDIYRYLSIWYRKNRGKL